jgi:hypothetical protein
VQTLDHVTPPTLVVFKNNSVGDASSEPPPYLSSQTLPAHNSFVNLKFSSYREALASTAKGSISTRKIVKRRTFFHQQIPGPFAKMGVDFQDALLLE